MRSVLVISTLSILLLCACSKRMGSLFNKDGFVKKTSNPEVPKSVYKREAYAIDFEDCTGREIQLRYLGCGGFYIGNEEEAILIDPFFSNRSLVLASPAGWIKSKPKNIRHGLKGIEQDIKEKVKGVYVTHAHYDHLLDVPYVYERYLSANGKAKIYTSTSGKKLLSSLHIVKDAVVDLQQQPLTSWNEEGQSYPSESSAIEVTPILTSHAPHYKNISFFKGEAKKHECYDNATENTFTNHWKLGQTFSFLVDFKDESGNIVFRIYIQSSAAPPKDGYIPQLMLDEKGVDLAIIGAASYANTNDYPTALIDYLKPKKIIVCHWEDFFVQYKRKNKRIVRFTKLKDFVNVLNDTFPHSTPKERERFTMPDPGVDITIKY